MSDSLYRRLAREYGAMGARESDIERLREFCGGWLPPDYESFLYEVGDCSEMDFSFISTQIECVREPRGNLPVSLSRTLLWYERSSEHMGEGDELRSLVIGATWGGNSTMALAEPSVVFNRRIGEPQNATGSLLAGSFSAYEEGLVLPKELANYQRFFLDTFWEPPQPLRLRKPLCLDPIRGVTVFDGLLDSLIEKNLERSSSSKEQCQFGIFGSDHHLFEQHHHSIAWGSNVLLKRFDALSLVLEIVVILDQAEGTLTDNFGLFSDRFDAEYSKAEIVDILVDRLAGARCLDELALLFREKFSVPAAKRLIAAQPRQV